jgi:hypothetical protein
MREIIPLGMRPMVISILVPVERMNLIPVHWRQERSNAMSFVEVEANVQSNTDAVTARLLGVRAEDINRARQLSDY